MERVPTGIPGLDPLIEGGFVKGSINLIAGQCGTGKTIFCCQFLLEGLRRNEPGVYLTLEESEEDILKDVARFGWDAEFKDAIGRGKFMIVSMAPTGMRELQEITLRYIHKLNAQRFALDSLSIATMAWKISAAEVSKMRSEVFDFFKALKRTGVTSLLITEIPEARMRALSRFGFEEFLADGVIVLYYLEFSAGGLPRSLLVRKMRRTKHTHDIHPLEITDKGIRVY